MAYSKWSTNSNWYSFWNKELSGEKRLDQVLSLWYISNYQNFRYDELINFCIDDIQTYYLIKVPDDDILEAVGIVNNFIKDVERVYV